MIGEASFHGLYIPWLMLLCGAALGLHLVARRLLAATGLYRWVWHPALFDIALYVVLLYATSSASALLQPR